MQGSPQDGTHWKGRSKKYKPADSKVGTMPDFEYTFPDGFTLVIDTREPSNGLFMPKPPKGLSMVRDTLATGDYSIRGFETLISIERKEVPDLIHCCGADRDRFQDQLTRLSKLAHRWLLIEGTEEETLSFQPYTQMHPNHIRGALVSIEVRYGIPVHFSRTRKSAERWVLDILTKFYRIKREEGV
jgi:ERCC4-type nuclease